MHRTLARVASLALSADGLPLAKLACAEQSIPRAGQFTLALLPGRQVPLRSVCFPQWLHADGFSVRAEPAWQPGDSLDLLGPVGRGFHPPGTCMHWLLAGIDHPVDRLFPLVQQALDARASVAVSSSTPVAGLPAAVEVVRDLREALGWADYLALDVSPELVGELGHLLGPRPGPVIEVLVTPELPCGLGLCQACRVQGSRSPRLACVDGPVFPWPIDRKRGRTATWSP